MTCHSGALLGKGKSPDAATLLTAWGNGRTIAIAHWMKDLKTKGKSIKYVSANDIGYKVKTEKSVFEHWDEETLS
jgi:hypothetical protein